MKIGIISDIHSNYRAFKVCLDYFENVKADYYLLLGDYVSDTPCPEKVMKMIYDLMREKKVMMVRGNREDYFLEDRAMDCEWKDCSATGNLLYTKERLTEEDITFFENLPISDRFSLEGYPSITFCHGSPESTREHIYMDTENSDRWLERINTDYLISGHTHQRCIYSHKGKTYINTGSCGIPIHNAGKAECVLLTGISEDGRNTWKTDMLSIGYDSKALVEEIFSSGLYDRAHWFMNANIQTLTSGIDRAAYLVDEAYALMKGRNSNLHAAFPSEKDFEEAALRINVPDYDNNRKPVCIRMATEEDAEELLKIYSHYVINTAVTYEIEVPSVEEFKNRIRTTRAAFPYYVAEKDGRMLGYAYASKFRARAAYDWDSELSIYVNKDSHGLGIGSLLLDAVEETLRRQGIVNLYAVISDSPARNRYIPGESVPFHLKHGFVQEGHFSKIGVKFGEWFDSVYLVKRLKDNEKNPSRPQPYFVAYGKY